MLADKVTRNEGDREVKINAVDSPDVNKTLDTTADKS